MVETKNYTLKDFQRLHNEVGVSSDLTVYQLEDNNENELAELVRVVELAFTDEFRNNIEFTNFDRESDLVDFEIVYQKNDCTIYLNLETGTEMTGFTYQEIVDMDWELEN